MRRLIFLPFLLIVLSFVGCKERIIHDLSEGEANRLVSYFHEQGLAVEKERQPEGTWAISVAKANTSEAIVLLDQSRLTRRARGVPSRQGGFLASREQQQLEYARMLAHDVEQTLLTIDGVFEARVHLHFPAQDPILGPRPGEKSDASASVLLVASQSVNVPSLEVAKVVSGASGIPVDRVAVLVTAPTNQPIIEREFSVGSLQSAAAPRSTLNVLGAHLPGTVSLLLGAVAAILALFLLYRSYGQRKASMSTQRKESSSSSLAFSRSSEKELGGEAVTESAEDGFRKLLERAREAA